MAEDKRKHEEELAQKERERIAELKKQKEEEDRKRTSELEQNTAINEYYLALTDQNDPSKRAPLPAIAERLAKWPQLKNAPPAFARRVKLILEAILPNVDKLPEVIMSHEALFKEQSLPCQISSNVPIPPTAKVAKMDAQKGISLKWMIEKAATGKTFHWNSLTTANYFDIVEKRLLAGDGSASLVESNANPILSFILLNSTEEKKLDDALTKLSMLDKDTKELWKAVAGDFKIAAKEVEAINTWNQLATALKNNDQRAFDKNYCAFVLGQADSGTFTRYAIELKRLHDSLSGKSPLIEAVPLYQAIMGTNDPQAKIRFCTQFLGRFGNLQALKDEGLTEKVSAALDTALDGVVNTATLGKSTKLPFAEWELAIPSDSWAFEESLKKTGPLKNAKGGPVVSTFDLAASLEYGDWVKASAIQVAGKAMRPEELAEVDSSKTKIQAWAVSFIFAEGLIGMRYNIQKLEAEAISRLEQLATESDSAQVKSDATAFGMYLAMATRNRMRALDLFGKFKPSPTPTPSDIRVALLHLLALLQAQELKPNDLSSALAAIAELMESSPDLKSRTTGDALWLKTAADMAAGQPPQNNKVDLEGLAAAPPCRFPDACGQILLASMAKNAQSGHPIPHENELLKLVAGNVRDNVVSQELWVQLLAYKIARSAATPAKLPPLLAEARNDFRRCSLGFYPKLRILSTAVLIMRNPSAATALSKDLGAYLDATPLASDAEKSAPAILATDTPVESLKSLSIDGKPSTGFWCGVAALIAGDATTASTVWPHLESNTKFHSQEERLLIMSLKNLPRAQRPPKK